MILKIDCPCGNKDPKKAVHYEGSLGYEAIYCRVCGRYWDHNGEFEPDESSKEFLIKIS